MRNVYDVCDRCEGCLAVILEQVQFLNNSAIHGGGLDINGTLPNPVIIVNSQFTYNSARVVTDDDGNSNLTTTLAGNGGGIRCLGGEPPIPLPLLCHPPFVPTHEKLTLDCFVTELQELLP